MTVIPWNVPKMFIEVNVQPQKVTTHHNSVVYALCGDADSSRYYTSQYQLYLHSSVLYFGDV